jgi:hypothetical protein
VKAKRCPFCREPAPRGKDEANKRVMKRIKANDPDAINYMGDNVMIKGITMLHLIMQQKRLNWVMRLRITN